MLEPDCRPLAGTEENGESFRNDYHVPANVGFARGRACEIEEETQAEDSPNRKRSNMNEQWSSKLLVLPDVIDDRGVLAY